MLALIRRLRLGLAIPIAAAALFFSAAPASAWWWTHPTLYNKTGGYIGMYYVPSVNSWVKVWLPSGDRFYEECYIDNQWYYGNYWTNRWFLGTDAWGYYGYVHASYVSNQVSVRHC
jgi:hypothetical protein